MDSNDSDYRHIEKTYDEGSYDYSGYFSQPHNFIEEERQQFVDRLPAGSRILDCGCGPGMDTEKFSQLGYKVTAIDLSTRFVEFTKKRVPNARVQKMNMIYLKFPEATFDGLWSSFSLLHIRERDIGKTFSGFKSVLRRDGNFFTALHRGPRTQWVKAPIAGMERDTFVQEWTQVDVEAALRQSGFKIIASRPFERKGGRYPLLSILAHTSPYKMISPVCHLASLHQLHTWRYIPTSQCSNRSTVAGKEVCFQNLDFFGRRSQGRGKL